jgi:hypothetical protein
MRTMTVRVTPSAQPPIKTVKALAKNWTNVRLIRIRAVGRMSASITASRHPIVVSKHEATPDRGGRTGSDLSWDEIVFIADPYHQATKVAAIGEPGPAESI